MEKENHFEKTVLDYEGYVSIRSMLVSDSKSDQDVGLGILDGIDQRKCLPFILFLAIEFSASEKHTIKTVLWAMYRKFKCLSAINSIYNVECKHLADPFAHVNASLITKLVDNTSVNSFVDSSTNTYLDRIIERLSITQVIDAIVIQDDPERFYELEIDIHKFLANTIITSKVLQKYKIEIPGFHMTFNIRNAIQIRKNELDKK